MTYPFAINPFSIPWKISSWRFFSNPDEKNLFWQLPVPTSGSFVCLSIYSYKVIVFRLAMLLSQFSRVRLYATPETAAHQAPPSLGFSRQEHWSGCHFLLQCMQVKSESEVAQSCSTLSDCSLPGSSVHGMFQARVLEWGAFAFSVRLAMVFLKWDLLRAGFEPAT